MRVGILLAQFLMAISLMLLWNWHWIGNRQKFLEEVKDKTLLKFSLLLGGDVFISQKYFTSVCHFSHVHETNVSGDLLCPHFRQMTLTEQAKVSKIYVFMSLEYYWRGRRVAVIFRRISRQPIGTIFKIQKPKKSKVFWPLKMVLMCCPETSVRNYHYTLWNIP